MHADLVLVCGTEWTIRIRKRNSIVTSFNRNFAKRQDGNPNTLAFVASPEITTALTLAGKITFNPATDVLKNDEGEEIKLNSPYGDELPENGFEPDLEGFISPIRRIANTEVIIKPDSKRLQFLEKFQSWDGNDLDRSTIVD